MRWVQLIAALVGIAALSGAATGCGSSDSEVEPVAAGDDFDEPTALAFRPGDERELWVTNHGDDSIAVVSETGAETTVVNRRDGYAEHFVARPSGIAFDDTGEQFAVSNDSDNGVRGLVFRLNPERNRFFKGNNFMGPTLFETDTYAQAGQSKRYLQDWPQPGYGHDPPDGSVARPDCPERYWSVEAESCVFPREGSHLDMLHETPLSAGILHWTRNVFFVLDGCGKRTADNRCRGDGHVVMADFNRDHEEGNGFHGDGVIRRYPDAPFRRSEGVPSGIVEHDGAIYYADTGSGVVRRLDPEAGRTEVLVGPWHPGAPSHHKRGTGITDWQDAANGPPDGDDPAAIDDWIARAGDHARIAAPGSCWVKPQETLGEYSSRVGARGEVVVPAGEIEEPSGLATDEERLYVADHATGRVHSFDWNGMEPGPVLETGAEGLGGLAVDPDGDWLYLTDTEANRVSRIRLD
ncbi:MAG: YncE family protein [Solirubrobacterales bacterium]